ncbi:hypothetical protein GCM10009642_48580 [Nocardiopsis metallicus]
MAAGRPRASSGAARKEEARRRRHERRATRAPRNSPAKAAEYAKAARLEAQEAARRKDGVEKTSTMLARSFDTVRFEDLKITNMTASVKGTAEQPGQRVRRKSGVEPGRPGSGDGGCSVPAPATKRRAAWRTCPFATPVCVAATVTGSTRTRVRVKPSSSVVAGVFPATPTPVLRTASRQGRTSGRHPLGCVLQG